MIVLVIWNRPRAIASWNVLHSVQLLLQIVLHSVQLLLLMSMLILFISLNVKYI